MSAVTQSLDLASLLGSVPVMSSAQSGTTQHATGMASGAQGSVTASASGAVQGGAGM